ncbi:MAG: DUF885 domain-containing protein [Verrucomicrobiota bacterium]
MKHSSFGATLAMLLALTCPAWADPDMNTRFTEISERFLEDLLRASPVTATNLGDHRYDDQLNEVDDAARKQQAKAARERLDELDKLDVSQLTRENQVDGALLRQRLEKTIWTLETLREWEWNPLVYTGLPGTSLYLLLSREVAPLNKRLANVAARCRQLPRFFEQARSSLVMEDTPQIHAETAVDQNKGILTLFDKLVVPHLDGMPAAERTKLEDAVHIAREAVEVHQRWLENELLPQAKGNPRLSEERYRQKFAFDLFSSLSPEALRQRSEAEKEALHQRMYDLSLRIMIERDPEFTALRNPTPDQKKELIRLCLEFAYDDAPEAEEVVDAAYHSLKITTDFVREKDLVSLPDDPLEIILMPEFRRGVSVAYCDAPGPLETGGRTFYAVSPPPEDWTAEQVDSFLREYNHRSLHNLTVHEAMPGHYVQLLRSNETANRLRSVLSSGTFIEGWAVYTESMMVEQGFLPGDLLMRLIVLKWNLRGVTNALLDQMIHLDGIDEETAMRLMVDDAFQEEREAAGKYRRSLLTSVQLSTYFAGYLEVLDILDETKKAWGSSFELKRFHDELMAFGSPSPAFVKALLLDQPIP